MFFKKLYSVGVLLLFTHTLSAAHSAWRDIQNTAQYGVVQIINHGLDVDVFAPFRRMGTESRGSGFIIEDGYVVTNFHVIKNGIKIYMQMPLLFGNQRFELKLIGIAPDVDIALLKIQETDCAAINAKHGSMPALPLGDSSTIKRSDELLGIGFPLGQASPKSATGIVSGYEKITVGSAHFDAVQVTKPTNSGNSGGPIFNNSGLVVAIDVAGPSVPTDNIAYAIPSNELRYALAQLKTGMVVKKSYLGCEYCYAKDNEIAQFLGNPEPAGCYITTVFQGGLFAAWGIQAGDMIYEINDFSVDPYGYLQDAVDTDRKCFVDYLLALPVDSQIKIVLYRSEKKIEKKVTMMFKEDPTIKWNYADYAVDYEIVGGLLIQELSLNLIQAFSKTSNSRASTILAYQKNETKKTQPVLVVTQLLTGSLALESRSIGFGEFIVKVNGISVTNLKELRAALLSSSGDFITLKNDEQDVVALKKSELYKQEQALADYFGYTITPGIKALFKRK